MTCLHVPHVLNGLQDWRGAETNSKELCLVLIASVYGSYGAPRQPWGNSTLCDVRITGAWLAAMTD